jgi:hypothetical protein
MSHFEKGFTGTFLFLCIDENGDKKKGRRTDYVARQYIGKLGKIDIGIVSVNADGVLEGITFPLLFEVFKPRRRLKATDGYQTKPPLALQLICTLKQLGFPFHLIVADGLYGESSEFLEGLLELDLAFVVAIRANHRVLLGPGQRVRYMAWRPFARRFADGGQELRYLCESVFGQRRDIRYDQLTTDPETLPDEPTGCIMTNLAQAQLQDVGNVYGMRMWIEYGFKQSKQELGWSDFRVTSYPAIEKWWEMVSSASLTVSLQAAVFTGKQQPVMVQGAMAAEAQLTVSQDATGREETVPQDEREQMFLQHKWWNTGKGWKHVLNNLRLIIQPYVAYCLLSPWLDVFHMTSLRESLGQLVTCMQRFQRAVPI